MQNYHKLFSFWGVRVMLGWEFIRMQVLNSYHVTILQVWVVACKLFSRHLDRMNRTMHRKVLWMCVNISSWNCVTDGPRLEFIFDGQIWPPFQKGLRLIASFLNTRFAIDLRLISIRTINRDPLWNGALVFVSGGTCTCIILQFLTIAMMILINNLNANTTLEITHSVCPIRLIAAPFTLECECKSNSHWNVTLADVSVGSVDIQECLFSRRTSNQLNQSATQMPPSAEHIQVWSGAPVSFQGSI